MSWERARTEDQKAERVHSILAAAGGLFMTREFHLISMGDIAREVGFTRPNLYRYFTTKEEIFLAILESDLAVWIGELEREILPVATPDREWETAIFEFARWWVAHLTAQPRLPRLLALMSFSLDDNAGEQRLKEFKLGLADISRRIAIVVRTRLPWISNEQLADFATLQLALVTGLLPMTTRGEVHNRVLEDPRLKGFAIEFEDQYRKALELCLRGMRR